MSVATRALQRRSRTWARPRRAGLLCARAGTLAIFAESDLEEDEAGGQDEADADEHEGEDRTRTSADRHGADRPGDHEGRG